MRNLITKALNSIQNDIDFWVIGNAGNNYTLTLLSDEIISENKLTTILNTFEEFDLHYMFHVISNKHYVFTLITF